MITTCNKENNVDDKYKSCAIATLINLTAIFSDDKVTEKNY